ncbi:MAG: rhamnulokinase [Lentisphaeria bacterium]|nr:rhamnulokinase [Lentisphaeria bacterium]
MIDRRGFLAFDLGASGGRGILGFLNGGKLELQEVHRFVNGPVRQDGSLFWDFESLQRELVEGLRKALVVTRDIAGIGIDTWGVDYVLCDRRTGIARRMPYHYRDARCARGEAAVRQRLDAAALYRFSGIQDVSLNTVYQLAAHRMDHPEDFDNADFLMIPDALLRFLGADKAAEYTDASTTALLDPFSRTWNDNLLGLLDIPRDIFPPIAEPGTAAGLLRADLAAELGCDRIPLYRVASHDTASAVVAVPSDPGEEKPFYLSTGTWALLGAELDGPIVNDAGRKANFTNEGGFGGKIRYLRNIMGLWLLQEIRRTWNESGRECSFARMEEMAAAEQFSSCLLDLTTDRFMAPDNMPERVCAAAAESGVVFANDGAMLRSVYDSLARTFADHIDQLEQLLGVRCPVLHVVGGGTRDQLLVKLTAAALNRPVTAGPVEGTAVGNLLVQLIAAGELNGLAEARQVVSRSFPVATVEPDPVWAEKFAALRG